MAPLRADEDYPQVRLVVDLLQPALANVASPAPRSPLRLAALAHTELEIVPFLAHTAARDHFDEGELSLLLERARLRTRVAQGLLDMLREAHAKVGRRLVTLGCVAAQRFYVTPSARPIARLDVLADPESPADTLLIVGRAARRTVATRALASYEVHGIPVHVWPHPFYAARCPPGLLRRARERATSDLLAPIDLAISLLCGPRDGLLWALDVAVLSRRIAPEAWRTTGADVVATLSLRRAIHRALDRASQITGVAALPRLPLGAPRPLLRELAREIESRVARRLRRP